MRNQENIIKERRGNSLELIDHMLVERQQLLALLLQVSGINLKDAGESDQELIDEFCQVLVDYIAAGHFGLYDRIVKKQERRKEIAELAVKVYPRIDVATQIALSFNEKYDANNGRDLTNFQQDLSQLGEEITTRLELEDQLISCLLESKEAISA